MTVSIPNQWSGTFSQPAAFGTTPPALQSLVVQLVPANSVGGGSGTPTAGNWLVVITGLNEQAATSGFTVGVKDDTCSYWRPGKVSASAALTRCSVWYTANTQRAPGYVYVHPGGALDAMAVLVLEVSGLGPWDTLSVTPYANYAAAATSLNLALPAPSASSAVFAATVGDSAAAGQAFAPASWTTLSTVSATNGVDHTCDCVLTSAYLPSTSGSISVNGTASSATDLSGVAIEFQINAASPIPGGANAAWPGRVILEAAIGSGFATPEDGMVWTSLSDNAWTSMAQGYKRFWSWQDSGGVPYALGQLQSGTGNVQLDNADGKVSPSNPAALFYTSAAGWSPQASFYDPLITAQAPLAWWKLADATGSGTAADSSGNSHTGTATSVTFGSANEAVGGNTSASLASSSTSHILSSYNPALSAVTVEAWVNLNSLSQSGNPVLAANSSTSSDHKGFVLGLSGTTPQVTFGNTSTSAAVTASSALPATGWAYVAATWDGTTVTLYVNGVSQGTAALSGSMPAGTAAGIGLGYNPASSSGYLNGLLAECAVYGSALTGQQIAAHYTAGPSGTGVPVRLRCALGTIGGVTYNRWHVISRNALKWPEKRNKALRGFVDLSLTDIWSGVSGSCSTPFRGEVRQDAPQSWWAMDDQPGSGGVQPTTLRNSAAGNTNPLTIYAASGGVTAGDAYTTTGTDATAFVPQPPTIPPSVAVYAVAQQQGWMYGDPQASPASYSTGNPVTASPGSAAWQQTGLAGAGGANGWFMAANDSSFPPLAAGASLELWWNPAFFGTSTGWTSPTSSKFNICGQPYSVLTLATLATASAPVAILQLDLSGHLNLITYNGATPTTHSIYGTSDLRSASWHQVILTTDGGTWNVYVDGGLTASVSGSGAGMTSAWTWLVIGADLGSSGGSTLSAATHMGNMAYSQAIVYPQVLTPWRVTARYAAAITGFGLLPAPQTLAFSSVANKTPGVGYTPDGSLFNSGNHNNASAAGYGSTGTAVVAYSFSAVAAAQAGSYTSGPSARAVTAGLGVDSGGIFIGQGVWLSFTSLAPSVGIYTSASADAETNAATVAGSGDSFSAGFGSGATGNGVCQTAAGTGASPPAGPSSLGDTVAQRIERILGYGGVTPPRAIDADANLLVQAALDVGGQQAGASIQAQVDSDNGLLYVGSDGALHYKSRTHLAADQAAAPVWNIGMNVAGGQWPFDQSITYGNDPQQVFDSIAIQPYSPDGSTPATIVPVNATAANAAQSQFGVRPKSVTSYLQDQAKIQSAANWWLANFGSIRRRVEVIKVNAESHPAAWPLILAGNPGDIILAYDAPFGAPATTGNYRISSISRQIGYGANGSQVEASATIVADPLPSSYWS